MRTITIVLTVLPAVLLCCASVHGADYPWRPYAVSEKRAPCVRYEPLRQVFFGDTHVHTAYSLDAGTLGTRNTPDDAYRFARGERLGIQPYDDEGTALRSIQLERPLDFAAVTDHAEFLGETAICLSADAKGYYSLPCLLFRWAPRLAFVLTVRRMMDPQKQGSRHGFCGASAEHCLAAADSRWRETLAAAERAYDRSEDCTFSAFAGYEWTGALSGGNLHRNIIFRNDTVPPRPLSFLDTQEPRELWQWLQQACNAAGTGCGALAIPHNSNISGGYMFPPPQAQALAAGEAALRAAVEPLMEITQHKGDSECWQGGGVQPEDADDLCAYEKLPYVDFAGVFKPKNPPLYPWAGFARGALASGLRYAAGGEGNPYRLGFVGSTDTHLGTPGAVAERGYPGHGGGGKSARSKVPPGLPDNPLFGPGGLAAVWAEENTRDALFSAMQRRETYGTSGPRMRVRFFGGWHYPAALCRDADFVARGYREGVPMGGELPPPPPAATAPSFAVRAHQDPGSASSMGMPLQRVQIVKGWVDGEGHSKERVFEVAGDADNGAAVDLATCEPRGTGFKQLCTVWRDPDFAFEQHAYYYARVVENPSCRWSQYICNARGVDCRQPETIGKGLEPCCAAQHRPVIQERAWTSPIWYRPAPVAAGLK